MLDQLRADRARIKDLQATILHLESSLLDLRREQSQAQERLDAYKYPVLTLPNELVSEIFIHTLRPYPEFPDLTGPFSLFPTRLTHICQSWRAIALATPELWSAISSFDHDDEELELHLFELWLQRSRSHPLSISLGSEESWPSEELVDAIIPHRARWQFLNLNLGSEDLRIFDGPMPLLQRLDLTLGGEAPPASIVIHEVPLLRTVTVNDTAAWHIILPWPQLTSLTLSNVYPSECIVFLTQARNLVHCQLDIVFDDSEEGISIERRDIVLLCLESLVLTDPGAEATTDFLPTLILPALRSLTVPEGFLSPNPFNSLTAFISKSGCRLAELHLTDEPIFPEALYRQAFPYLQKLTFDGANEECLTEPEI
ncbi:hypothetical protein C8R47DRAFT_1164202 [Mycena vitilis]|nr:hypothetical protein C8R47DRAFT_1164202 [Mycena vitilis]